MLGIFPYVEQSSAVSLSVPFFANLDDENWQDFWSQFRFHPKHTSTDHSVNLLHSVRDASKCGVRRNMWHNHQDRNWREYAELAHFGSSLVFNDIHGTCKQRMTIAFGSNDNRCWRSMSCSLSVIQPWHKRWGKISSFSGGVGTNTSISSGDHVMFFLATRNSTDTTNEPAITAPVLSKKSVILLKGEGISEKTWSIVWDEDWYNSCSVLPIFNSARVHASRGNYLLRKIK